MSENEIQICAEDEKYQNTSELAELLKNSKGGEKLKLRVGQNLKHRRLDQYLNGRITTFSRTMIQKMIKEKQVLVNNKAVKPSYALNSGESISITLPEPVSKEITPENIPLNIIYEDDDIIVINKQKDLIVHPARGYKSGTLVNALVYYTKNLSSGSEDFRPGIVHRLDRNTTGAIIVAKNDEAQWKLADQFQKRTTKKTYKAIIHGNPELDADMIKNNIGVHPTIREKQAVRPNEGKEAITIYRVAERFKGFALVDIDILTGRTHQIRVHMSHIKHPIVGDNTYGGKDVYEWQVRAQEPQPQEPVIGRPALHAWKLEIDHPKSQKRMTFTADLPEDMENMLKLLREVRSLD